MKKHDIQAKIKDKFKNQKDAALALGISEGTLSKNLRKPTVEFIKRLKEIGVILNSDISQTFSGGAGASHPEGDMHGNFIGEPKEINYGVNSKTLDRIIESHEKTIEFLKEQIREKDLRIKELEQLLLKTN